MLLKINREDIPKHSNTPIFTYCRKLLKEGYPEDTRLEIYRNNSEPDVIIPNIGKAGKLSIKEDPYVRFVKYDPPSSSFISRKRSQVSL